MSTYRSLSSPQFQVLAYPVTRSPGTYAVIGATNAASLFANLFFLTPQWFRFRVWVKDFLVNVFCCRFPLPPSPLPIEEDIPDERGHTNNRPGYLRRQVSKHIHTQTQHTDAHTHTHAAVRVYEGSRVCVRMCAYSRVCVCAKQKHSQL